SCRGLHRRSAGPPRAGRDTEQTPPGPYAADGPADCTAPASATAERPPGGGAAHSGKIHIPPNLVVEFRSPSRSPCNCAVLPPILGHHLQRPSAQRVTHAPHNSPDPRKPNHHRRFSRRSHVLSAAGR